MVTDSSSHWQAFTQLGDEFLWLVPTAVNNASLGTTPVLVTTGAPLGIQCFARLRFLASGSASNALLLQSVDETSAAANAVGGNDTGSWVGSGHASGEALVRTDTSAQIRYSAAAVGANVSLATFGWIDRRGRDG
jgi:hypothetical protein